MKINYKTVMNLLCIQLLFLLKAAPACTITLDPFVGSDQYSCDGQHYTSLHDKQ